MKGGFFSIETLYTPLDFIAAGGIRVSQSKNRSTKGCSKLKSPETRQVHEILVTPVFFYSA